MPFLQLKLQCSGFVSYNDFHVTASVHWDVSRIAFSAWHGCTLSTRSLAQLVGSDRSTGKRETSRFLDHGWKINEGLEWWESIISNWCYVAWLHCKGKETDVLWKSPWTQQMIWMLVPLISKTPKKSNSWMTMMTRRCSSVRDTE